jgi:hypothetical protein
MHRQPSLVFRQSAIDEPDSGCSDAPSELIHDHELLFHGQAFRDDGPRTTGPQEFGDCGEKMGEEYQ